MIRRLAVTLLLVACRTVAQTPAEKAPPIYPPEALFAGIDGSVVVHGTLGADGRLHGLRAVSGPEALRQAAVDAVSLERYRVGKDSQRDITVNFVATKMSPLPMGAVRVTPKEMETRLVEKTVVAKPFDASTGGMVTMEAYVGTDGMVSQARVLNGPVMLWTAAIQGVQTWHYKPYLVDGKPTVVQTLIVVPVGR
jgi:outer membrane biosynthesis protein TonB